MIWCNVGGRKETFSAANFTVPPVLVGAVCNGDNVTPPEVQFARLLWNKIVQGLHQDLQKKKNDNVRALQLVT